MSGPPAVAEGGGGSEHRRGFRESRDSVAADLSFRPERSEVEEPDPAQVLLSTAGLGEGRRSEPRETLTDPTPSVAGRRRPLPGGDEPRETREQRSEREAFDANRGEDLTPEQFRELTDAVVGAGVDGWQWLREIRDMAEMIWRLREQGDPNPGDLCESAKLLVTLRRQGR